MTINWETRGAGAASTGTHGYCAGCLKQGHQCWTDRKNDDGQFECVFCEDREPCPFANRSPNNSPETVGTTVKKGGREESPEPRVAAPSRVATRMKALAPQGPELNPGEETMEKTCKCSPGCPKVPKDGSEYAWGHQPKAARVAAPTNVKVCKEPGCAEILRTDNKSGLCKKHRNPNRDRTVPAKLNKIKNPPQPKWEEEAPAAAAISTKATLQFSEEQLNQLFLQSTLEQKAECIQTWLGRYAN